jgi:hypothetical protein
VGINNINIDNFYAYSLICFPFQSAIIEPPQIDLVEYGPDVPRISDRRTGEPLLFALPTSFNNVLCGLKSFSYLKLSILVLCKKF